MTLKKETSLWSGRLSQSETLQILQRASLDGNHHQLPSLSHSHTLVGPATSGHIKLSHCYRWGVKINSDETTLPKAKPPVSRKLLLKKQTVKSLTYTHVLTHTHTHIQMSQFAEVSTKLDRILNLVVPWGETSNLSPCLCLWFISCRVSFARLSAGQLPFVFLYLCITDLSLPLPVSLSVSHIHTHRVPEINLNHLMFCSWGVMCLLLSSLVIQSLVGFTWQTINLCDEQSAQDRCSHILALTWSTCTI